MTTVMVNPYAYTVLKDCFVESVDDYSNGRPKLHKQILQYFNHNCTSKVECEQNFSGFKIIEFSGM